MVGGKGGPTGLLLAGAVDGAADRFDEEGVRGDLTAAPDPRCRIWGMDLLKGIHQSPILLATALISLSIGCTFNSAEVEQLRKELDALKAATPGAVTRPPPSSTSPHSSTSHRNCADFSLCLEDCLLQ